MEQWGWCGKQVRKLPLRRFPQGARALSCSSPPGPSFLFHHRACAGAGWPFQNGGSLSHLWFLSHLPGIGAAAGEGE